MVHTHTCLHACTRTQYTIAATSPMKMEEILARIPHPMRYLRWREEMFLVVGKRDMFIPACARAVAGNLDANWGTQRRAKRQPAARTSTRREEEIGRCRLRRRAHPAAQMSQAADRKTHRSRHNVAGTCVVRYSFDPAYFGSSRRLAHILRVG